MGTFSNTFGEMGGQGTMLNQITPEKIANLKLWLKPTSDMYEDVANTTPITGAVDNRPIASIKNKAGSDYLQQSNWMISPFLRILNNRQSMSFSFDNFSYNKLTSSVVGSGSYRPFTHISRVIFTDFAAYRTISDCTAQGGIGVVIQQTTGKIILAKSNVANIGVSNTALLLNTEYVIAVTYDNVGNWAIYINNVLDASGLNNQAISANIYRQIGAYATNANPMYGNIFEICEYNSVLTTAQLTGVYNYLKSKQVTYKYAASGYFSTGLGKLYVIKSNDAINWTYEPEIFDYKFSTNKIGAPSIIYSDGFYYVASVNIQYAEDPQQTIVRILKSSNLKNWTLINTVNVGGGATAILNLGDLAWFKNTDGTISLILNGTTATTWTNWQFYEIHATSADLSTWSLPVLITGTGLNTNMIDPYMVKIGIYYYLFYKKEGVSRIAIMRSESLTSGFTIWKDLSTVIPLEVEGPHLLKIDGGWRLYADNWQSHKYVYAESFDDFNTWSIVKDTSVVPYLNHWTPLEIGVNTQYCF